MFGSYTDIVGSLTSAGSFYAVEPGRPHTGRILSGSGRTSGISYSDDRGATWQLPDLSAFPLHPQNFVDFAAFLFRTMPSGRILSGAEWGVATSDDDGSSWAPTPLFEPFRWQIRALTAAATPGSSQTGAPACGQPDPALCDGAIAVGTTSSLVGIQAWRTNDGGRSWSEPVALPQPYDGIGAAMPAAVIALGTEPDGLGRAVAILGRGLVYVTRDGGQS